MHSHPIHTQRLTLIAASPKHIQAELMEPPAIGELLGADVPSSWPPGEYDRAAQKFFLEQLMESGENAVGWFGWYAVRRADVLHPATLVGAAGYFGPPNEAGVVEIGYSLCPEWRGNGLATEMARALVERAAAHALVTSIVARTNSDNAPSVAVLEHCNFARVAPLAAGQLRFEWRGRERS